jgi:hypothetical protein
MTYSNAQNTHVPTETLRPNSVPNRGTTLTSTHRCERKRASNRRESENRDRIVYQCGSKYKFTNIGLTICFLKSQLPYEQFRNHVPLSHYFSAHPASLLTHISYRIVPSVDISRVTCYQPLFHRHLHLVIFFNFVTDKICL